MDMNHEREHGNARKPDVGGEGRAGREEAKGRQDCKVTVTFITVTSFLKEWGHLKERMPQRS